MPLSNIELQQASLAQDRFKNAPTRIRLLRATVVAPTFQHPASWSGGFKVSVVKVSGIIVLPGARAETARIDAASVHIS